MTDLQGALGCAQMERADEILDERRRLAARYDEALAGLDWLATPRVPEGNVHGYQSYVCLFGESASYAASEELHERAQRGDARARAARHRDQAGDPRAVSTTGYYSRSTGCAPRTIPPRCTRSD